MTRQFWEVPIAEVRDHWDSRPCNSRHSDAPIGTIEYYYQVVQKKFRVEPHIPSFANFPIWRGKKVLELGCGIGTTAVEFACQNAKVTAVDLSEKSLELAKLNSESRLQSNPIRFFCGNIEQLSRFLPLEKYDLVFSFGVLHHTPNPELVLEQIRSYLGSNGILKIMVYHRHSWKVLWILLKYGKGKFWRLKELIAEHSEAKEGCPVTYTYTKREVVDMLDRHGFHALQVRVEHIFPYQIEPYKRHEYKKEWWFRWMPGWLFHWLEHRIGWHLCVTAVPKGS